uniref:2-alkenal reductase (NAD(P)(+)) n=1 Tax=Opuntia streptacantha TaxID=393608 RepID=A0A7C8Z8S8_OPUST
MASSLMTDRAEIKRVFDRFDKNGDGTISASEMGGVLRALGSETSKEEVEKMMAELDIDKDGVVNFDEFAEFCARKLDGDCGLKELSEAFDMYDQDKNGLISANELHLVLSRLGQHCTVQDCEKMIKTVDSDGDGNVSFEEFRKMMDGNKTS